MEALSLVFIITSIIIIVVPGQDMVLVLSRSLALGKKAGVMTALGVSVGLMGHTVLAALGLGALLLASQWLFDLIKLIGAAYLIYIGYQLLFSQSVQLGQKTLQQLSYKKMFLQGALSDIMNVKIVVFYFAYLPQFVLLEAGNASLQLLILGSVFAGLTFLIKASVGFLAGSLSLYLSTKPVILQRINQCSGLIIIALGLQLASENLN